MTARSAPPLEGVQLVTIAQNVPGPVAVARLVAAGAHALKVEPPAGDPLAGMCRPWYDELHRGVAVERVDLKSVDGHRHLMTRLTDADIFITGQRPSALARLSLDGDTLAPVCPRLRVLRIVGALSEPETPGHDLTYQASAGLLRDRLPVTLFADIIAAERAVAGALSLLRQPPGSSLDIGLSDSLDPLVAPIRHGLTSPDGLLGGGLPTYGVYRTKAGRVAVAALEPHFQRRLFEQLDIANGEDLAPALLARTASEWHAWARLKDLPLVEVHE